MNFSPSVYEHAARLIKRTPYEVSRSADLLFQAHACAFETYKHSPVVVGIDIYNLEAEAYGAVIHDPKDHSIPAINEFPVTSVESILDLNPLDVLQDGRFPLVLQAGRRLQKEFPKVDIRIPVSGPFSIASNLIAFEAVLANVIEDPDMVVKVLQSLANEQIRLCDEITNQGLGISFFESAVTPPLLSPNHFEMIVLPILKDMIERVAQITRYPVPCIIGGNTSPIIENIVKTGTKYVICPSETDQQIFMQKMQEWPDVLVRINMDPAVFVSNDVNSLYKEIERVLELAGKREKVCIGTGVLPFEANPEMVLMAKRYISQ